ncbi:MAG: SDR family NAD(P)-dependent oxidoreductase [Alphaproteobacteria bacterium]
MNKIILITGSTDGIGFQTAKDLVRKGHHVLVHGRNPDKLANTVTTLAGLGQVEGYLADLSSLKSVESLAKAIADKHDHLDVLINNAGIFNTPNPILENGMDVRFVVNTIAPYLLTQKLLPLMNGSGRIINLSSAAQAPVNGDAFKGKTTLSASAAYAQSKLAILMWSRHMANALPDGPIIIPVNPGSLLGTKMVKEGYGMDGKDINIGSGILVRLALDPEFSSASGQYFDNDIGQFGSPHFDAMNAQKTQQVVDLIEAALN